LVLMFFS